MDLRLADGCENARDVRAKVRSVFLVGRLLQEHRLQIARELPDPSILLSALSQFRTKVTIAQETVLDWREREHDELARPKPIPLLHGRQMI